MNSTPVTPVMSFPDLALAPVSVTQGERFPCWEAKGAVYHIGLHLADSVPVAQLNIWREKRENIRAALADPGIGETVRQQLIGELKIVYNENVERYLESGHGECWLRNSAVAKAVANVLRRDNGRAYALHAYTIMPNHLHVLVGGFPEAGEMKTVINQWKRITAHTVNRHCGRAGEVWQRDTYTHIIRSREEYACQLKYIWENPEAAQLSEGFLRERFV